MEDTQDLHYILIKFKRHSIWANSIFKHNNESSTVKICNLCATRSTEVRRIYSLSRTTLVYFKSLSCWLFKRIRTLVTVHRTAGPAELSTSFLYNPFILSTIGNIHRTRPHVHIFQMSSHFRNCDLFLTAITGHIFFGVSLQDVVTEILG